jgi:hypothetical protein
MVRKRVRRSAQTTATGCFALIAQDRAFSGVEIKGTWAHVVWPVLIVSLVVLLATTDRAIRFFVACAPYFPRVRFSHEPELGERTITWKRAAKHPFRKKDWLADESFALAREILEHLATIPDPSVKEMLQFNQATRDSSEEEQEKQWIEMADRNRQHQIAVQRDLDLRFGGRVMHVISEYKRRGMIDDEEVRELRFKFSHMGTNWVAQVATRLEALGYQLRDQKSARFLGASQSE